MLVQACYRRFFIKKVKPVVLAYYFPNWHIDAFNEEWHGKGWTEWEVLKYSRPRFEGHKMPRTPAWGYLDESKPEVMEKKLMLPFHMA